MRRGLVVGLALLAAPALAEVQAKAEGSFVVAHVFDLTAEPLSAYRALSAPEIWWPSSHTWSGKAQNLRLELAAGGCFCEKWEGGSVEHARVVMAIPGKTLRIVGALGPLQEMGVTAVLTVSLEAREKGSRVRVTYRVSGDTSHALSALAPVVDQVIGEQFGRFARHANGESVD